MKKNVFFIMLVIMSMAVAVSFISCGGSDDDYLDGGTESQQSNFGYKFVEPCLEWGDTEDQVKTFMKDWNGWSLQATYTGVATTEMWETFEPVTAIGYTFGSKGLSNSVVTYWTSGESIMQDIISKIQTKYTCTFSLTLTSDKIRYYSSAFYVNGKRTMVIVYPDVEGGKETIEVEYDEANINN